MCAHRPHTKQYPAFGQAAGFPQTSQRGLIPAAPPRNGSCTSRIGSGTPALPRPTASTIGQDGRGGARVPGGTTRRAAGRLSGRLLDPPCPAARLTWHFDASGNPWAGIVEVEPTPTALRADGHRPPVSPACIGDDASRGVEQAKRLARPVGHRVEWIRIDERAAGVVGGAGWARGWSGYALRGGQRGLCGVTPAPGAAAGPARPPPAPARRASGGSGAGAPSPGRWGG